jgi:hypothetical protein
MASRFQCKKDLFVIGHFLQPIDAARFNIVGKEGDGGTR